MRPTRTVALLLLALSAVAPGLAGGPAYADHAPPLGGPVVDEAGALSGPEEARAGRALEELQRERGVQLRAVFVASTGGLGATEWADRAAAEWGLGGNDALLVVVPRERGYALWISTTLRREVTRQEVDVLLAREVEPELAAGDYAGAVVAAAGGLGQAEAGSFGSGRRGGGGARVLLLVVVAGVAGWLLLGAWRRRRARRGRERAIARDVERLAAEANARLIAADEDLDAAEREAAVARAPAADLEAYRAAIVAARERVRRAFDLRARLDDDEPEPLAERAEILDAIVRECVAAEELLAPPRQRLQELRDREQEAPAALEQVTARAAELTGRIEPAAARLTELREVAPTSVAAVEGNDVEARKRVEYATMRAAEGREAVTAGDLSAAATAAADAGDALDRAAQLLDAVDHLESAYAEAKAELPERLRDAEATVIRARASARADDDRPERAARTLAEARGAAGTDALAAYRLTGEAEALAEAVLGELRAQQERRDDLRRVLAAALRSAESAYTTAADFISARREGVGAAARARLHRAAEHLEQARLLAAEQPEQALGEARRAEAEAEAAYARAADDFDRLETHGGAYGGGFGGFGLPIPLPIPILIGGGGGWGGSWGAYGGGWGGGGWGGGGSVGGDFGGGDAQGGTW